MNKADLGHIIYNRRSFLELNQEDVAEMAGISAKTLYLLEQGKGNPSINTLAKLFEILGLAMSVDIKKVAE